MLTLSQKGLYIDVQCAGNLLQRTERNVPDADAPVKVAL